MRVLDDPTISWGWGTPSPQQLRADTAPGPSQPHSHRGGAFSFPLSAWQAEDTTAPPDCALQSFQSHLWGRCVAVPVLRGLWLTLSILGTILVRGQAQ